MHQDKPARPVMQKLEGCLWAFPTALGVVWCLSAAVVMIRAFNR